MWYVALVVAGINQTDYVWDFWDFLFIVAGAVVLSRAVLGRAPKP